jgi:hypothetical protein
MARKDERSTRLRQAYGAQARKIQWRTQDSAKECQGFVPDALVLDKRDLRNTVSIVVLCDLCVKVGARG